jgi:hypothetical protein
LIDAIRKDEDILPSLTLIRQMLSLDEARLPTSETITANQIAFRNLVYNMPKYQDLTHVVTEFTWLMINVTGLLSKHAVIQLCQDGLLESISEGISVCPCDSTWVVKNLISVCPEMAQNVTNKFLPELVQYLE